MKVRWAEGGVDDQQTDLTSVKVRWAEGGVDDQQADLPAARASPGPPVVSCHVGIEACMQGGVVCCCCLAVCFAGPSGVQPAGQNGAVACRPSLRRALPCYHKSAVRSFLWAPWTAPVSFSVPSVLVPGEYLALPISRRDGRGSDGGGGGGV